jgi:tetratricopeptide (TPR) repeat protein
MTDDSARFQTLMNQGHSAAWDQDWEKAADIYKLALRESPDHPMGLASLGLAHFQLRQYDDALQVYQRCSAISPDDPMPFEKMARIYERAGMLVEAVQAGMQAAEMHLKMRDVDRTISNFKDAIRIEPKNQTVHTRLAMVYDKLGKKPEAVGEYLTTAAIMQSLGDTAKAMQVVQYALQLAPNDNDSKKALTLLKNGQQMPLPGPGKGGTGPVRMSQVRQLETPEPGQVTTPKYDPLTESKLNGLKKMAGLLFEQTEDSLPIEPVNRRGFQIFNRGTGGLNADQAERTRIQLHLSQAIDLETAGQDDQAAVELERAIDLGLNQSASFYVFGLLIHNTAPQKALKYLQKSVKNPEFALGSYLLMADIYEKSEQYKEASANYLQALKLADIETVSPEDTDELVQLYEPIFELQLRVNQERDLRNLCTVISGQLMRPDWRAYLGEARKQLPPQAEGAPPLPLAEMLLETTSSQVVEALSLIRQLASEGKFRTAMEEAYHALIFAPTYLPLHIQMAELLILEGRIMEATEKFMVVSNLYIIRGETPQAIRLLTRVTKLAPMDLSVRSLLIDLLKSIGRLDDALQQYMDLGNVYYLLAELDMASQTYQAALSLSQKTSSTREWAIQILNKLADIELQCLDWKQSIKYFEQLRSLEPMEPAPRATLIDLYLRIGLPAAANNEMDAYLKLIGDVEHFSKATKFLDDLLEERPDNIEIQKRMVSVYTSRNQLPVALEKLDKLAEKSLGEENIEGALKTLQHLISINPPDVNEYKKLYEELKLKKK